MNNTHYKIDIKYAVASTKASLETLNKFTDNSPVNQEEIDDYITNRIIDWFQTFNRHEEIFEDVCNTIQADEGMSHILKLSISGIHKSISDDDAFVIALLELGALIRVEESL